MSAKSVGSVIASVRRPSKSAAGEILTMAAMQRQSIFRLEELPRASSSPQHKRWMLLERRKCMAVVDECHKNCQEHDREESLRAFRRSHDTGVRRVSLGHSGRSAPKQ